VRGGVAPLLTGSERGGGSSGVGGGTSGRGGGTQRRVETLPVSNLLCVVYCCWLFGSWPPVCMQFIKNGTSFNQR
jgi:hypothetical protein